MSSTQTCDRQWADRLHDFSFTSCADGPAFTRVTLSGELDLATAPQLAQALAEVPDGTAVVILDLSELTFMDSTGLHVIVAARARLAEAGRRLVLVPGGHHVQRIFEITGTKHHLEFVSAPNAPRPALVGSGTEAFSHAHLSRRQNANEITCGADHPSGLAVGPSATHSPLNGGGVDRDDLSSQIEGGAPDGCCAARQARPMSGRAPAGLPRSTAQHTWTSRSAAGPALRRAGVRELFARWQQDRDQAARDQLVERFLPLARGLARRYTGAHEPFEDLLQVASYGLLKAVDRFDAGRGSAFSSFAVPTIVGELKRYFRDLGWSAHVPRGAQELALKVGSAQEKLTTKTGRSPTVAELAQYLELSIEDVLDGLEAASAHHSSSLDAPHDDGDGESGTLADTLSQEDTSFELVEDAATVAAAMQTLSERERTVLQLRFFEERTQSEIGREIGVSQMQVSRILRRAITTLTERTLTEAPVANDQAPA